MYRTIVLLLCAVLMMTSGCSSSPDSESTKKAGDSSSTPGADPLSGTWTGDWGPSKADRNDVRLELKWDGSALTGTINPGDKAIPIKNASYDPATKTVKMEAEATGRAGTPVHYVIEGKVDGTSMTGTWKHETRNGDFSVSKS
jgi:hypothetical protein